MQFTNAPNEPRHLIATDYWESPAGKQGHPILSWAGNCFRLLLPVKASLGERYSQLGIVIQAISKTEYPDIVATEEAVSVIAGTIALRISWSNVYGIDIEQFPPEPWACDFAAYTYAGKRGPRLSFRRKATYSKAE